MKTAVIYYSMSGNCEYTAKKIAALSDADLIRLEPEKEFPTSGFRKFFWGGKSAIMGDMPKLKPYVFEAEKYDRIIFGFPVWAGNPAPPVRTFIHENIEGIRGKKYAAFVCYSGGGADKALVKLKKQLSVETLDAELILIDSQDKPDPKNDEAIKAFREKLI